LDRPCQFFESLFTESSARLEWTRIKQVDINLLTIEANDPRSGTAEFKAAAVRIDKLVPA
jgi:hypothetical protein